MNLLIEGKLQRCFPLPKVGLNPEPSGSTTAPGLDPGASLDAMSGCWGGLLSKRWADPAGSSCKALQLGGEEAEISLSGWGFASMIHISALHGEKRVLAQGQQRLYLPPRVPAILSVMIIKPCQQIWNQWMQLHRQMLRKPPRRPRSQVFVIHLENCGCHKSF